MFNFLIKKNTPKTTDILIATLLFTALLLLPDPAFSDINIDGRPDEPDWASARVFRDFVVTDPLTFETPRLPTEARLLSTAQGLAVAFICHQPPGETRTRTVTRRDAMDFESDAVSFMVDFDATGVNAYEFSVSITGSYRDGTITNETGFNYDWDGLWERATHEEPEFWSVEILIPWSIAAMKESTGDTRRIAVLFQRETNANGEKFAFPKASPQQSRFTSEFERIEVPRYSAREFDVWPYATVINDLVEESTTVKAGLDLFWKASGAFQVAATFNPDFGQVESDDLVINFTAIETRYSDKRPFFTENQSIFNSMISRDEYIFYTRRIGGESDRDAAPSDIVGAAKAIGSTGPVDYGLFAAQEEGDAGKRFYAGRMMYPGRNWSLGVLSTYVERPFIDRSALVNSIDYDIKPGDSWRLYGHMVGSMSDTEDDSRHGYGLSGAVEYTPNERWSWDASVLRYSQDFELNDMGYIERNSLDKFQAGAEYRRTDFDENSRIASVTWETVGVFEGNRDGVDLKDFIRLEREQKMRSGAEWALEAHYNTAGYDDLVSRGNGLVYMNDQLQIEAAYATPKRGAWRQSVNMEVFQEGYEDWGIGVKADVTWYPHDRLNLDFSLNPLWSRDWLIWLQEDMFESYSRRQLKGEITANWFPAESHEVRLRAQWLTIDADADQSYRIGPRGRLVESDDVVDDFAMINFGVQLRYRYEIAPLSDLYVVYSRGGLERIDNSSRSPLGLLGDATSLRDSDQFLIKLRYRF